MDKSIGIIVSFIMILIYICFSYELLSYQKALNEAMIETNAIALDIQKNGIDHIENEYFRDIQIELMESEYTYTYNITTIKSYNCEFSFFSFSKNDIVINTKVLTKK